ncbi:hypothetical protein [Bosea sp. MMO-172]|uniref:hypothetical protein n=1 Tax=Bosea sp. MMO-172 TaxID=3127885 RepID=UPI0030173E00
MKTVSEIVKGVELEALRVRVMDAQVWSETHVSGSGSGVMVKGFGVGSSKTTSTVVNKREVCFEAEDGLQIVEEFDAGKVTLMPGQDVTLIRAKRNGMDEPATVAIRNHSMRKSMWTGKDVFFNVLVLLALSPIVTLIAGFILIVYLSHAWSPNGLFVTFLIGLLAGNLYWLRGPAIRRRFKKRVADMLDGKEADKLTAPARSRISEIREPATSSSF